MNHRALRIETRVARLETYVHMCVPTLSPCLGPGGRVKQESGDLQ